MGTNYVIVNVIDADEVPLFWSNSLGWVSLSDAELFSDEEHKSLNLPLEGVWIKHDDILNAWSRSGVDV